MAKVRRKDYDDGVGVEYRLGPKTSVKLMLVGILGFSLCPVRAQAPPVETVGLPDTFVCTLQYRTASAVMYAGQAAFKVECNRLLFNANLLVAPETYSGAMLATPSRSVRVDFGPGEMVMVPMCEPVLVPGPPDWPPIYISCLGFYYAYYHTGVIPLNETLLRELRAGQGELQVFLLSTPPTVYPDEPSTLLSGSLLAVLNPGATNPAPCWPRAPRSITACYTPGPAAPLPVLDAEHQPVIDLDADGQPDFAFSVRTLCTMNIPPTCTTMYGVSCLSSNQMLAREWSVDVLEQGTLIGTSPPTNSTWGQPGMDALTSYTYGAEGCRPWSGELGRLGEGYLGVRLRLPDGDHYGWIRIRLPGRAVAPGEVGQPPLPIELSPVVEDWAYEPQPGGPIKAGAKPYAAQTCCQGMVRPGFLRLQVFTQPNRGYVVRHKPSLNHRLWRNLDLIFVASGAESQLDLPLSGPMGFYRVIEAD